MDSNYGAVDVTTGRLGAVLDARKVLGLVVVEVQWNAGRREEVLASSIRLVPIRRTGSLSS